MGTPPELKFKMLWPSDQPEQNGGEVRAGLPGSQTLAPLLLKTLLKTL